MNKLLRALLAPYLLFAVDDDTSKTTVETDPETGETVGTNNDERVARLNAIANANDEGREEELADINDDGSTVPFRAKEDGDDTPTGDQPQSTEVQPETPPTDTPAPEVKKYTLKVNGKEIEVTEDELIARAQKNEAADDYLRYAKNQARIAAAPAPAPNEPNPSEEVDFVALARAVQMGTEEEAVRALQTLSNQAKSRPSVTPDDVFRTVDERLEFKTAWNTFKTEFNDIVSDPILKNMAQNMDQELLDSNDDRPYLERYREIGTKLRDWIKSKAPAPAPAAAPAVPTLTQKQERKSSAPTVPTPASAKTTAQRGEEEEVDDTPSSVIANMARARGGPQWMRN